MIPPASSLQVLREEITNEQIPGLEKAYTFAGDGGALIENNKVMKITCESIISEFLFCRTILSGRVQT